MISQNQILSNILRNIYTHIHIYACLCILFTHPSNTDRVSLLNLLNKMAAVLQVLQFICIHTNLHTRMCMYIYIYISLSLTQ